MINMIIMLLPRVNIMTITKIHAIQSATPQKRREGKED